MVNASESEPAVLWTQVFGLAAMQGAISLAWVVYGLYLPQLLGEFGFPMQMAVGLFVVENLLAIALEPLMGLASDRMREWVGSQFPLVAIGAILASALFIGIPAVVIFGGSSDAARWVLIAVIIAWAIAMAVFRSPALSLLGRYANATNLPQAASVITLTGALTGGATAAFANQFILSLGPAVAFAIGSFVLLGAVALLRSINPNVELPGKTVTTNSFQPALFSTLGLIGGVGLGVGVGSALMKKLLNLATPGSSSLLLTTLFVLAHVLTIIPAGRLAHQLGNRRAMVFGLGTMAALMIVTGLIPGIAIATSILFGAAFSLVLNGTVPLALTLVPPNLAGVATGAYFAGAASATALLGIASDQVDSFSLLTNAVLGVLALSVAAGCIIVGFRITNLNAKTP